MNNRGRIAWGLMILQTALLLGVGALYVVIDLLGTVFGPPRPHHPLAYLVFFGYPLVLTYIWVSLMRPQGVTRSLAILSQAALIGMVLAAALAFGWPLLVALAFAAYPAVVVALLVRGVPTFAANSMAKAWVLGVMSGIGFWVLVAAGVAAAVIFGTIAYASLKLVH